MRAEGEEVAEPDWEQEMSIFKRRTLKPSQLEALRKLEAEKVDVGRVRNTRMPDHRPIHPCQPRPSPAQPC